MLQPDNAASLDLADVRAIDWMTDMMIAPLTVEFGPPGKPVHGVEPQRMPLRIWDLHDYITFSAELRRLPFNQRNRYRVLQNGLADLDAHILTMQQIDEHGAEVDRLTITMN